MGGGMGTVAQLLTFVLPLALTVSTRGAVFTRRNARHARATRDARDAGDAANDATSSRGR